MSTRFIVSAVVGVVVGYVSGSPQAGFQAFSLTYGVTGSLDPNAKVQGPRLDDLKIASGAYGAPIAYVEGHPRLAGNIIWSTDKREVANESTQEAKGGPGVDTTTFTYEVDMIVKLCENSGKRPRRIWSNGALVWTAAEDADSASVTASINGNSWREMRVCSGDDAQLPDPTYEAAVGVGNAPAYRGSSTIVFVGLNLGNSGQLPVLTFELADAADATTTLISEQLYDQGGVGVAAFVGPDQHTVQIQRWTSAYETPVFDTYEWDGETLGYFSSGSIPTGGSDSFFFIDGIADEPYYVAYGTGVFATPEAIDSKGLVLDPVVAADVFRGFARYSGQTIFFVTNGLSLGSTIVSVPFQPGTAAFYAGLWYVMPNVGGGTIYKYTTTLGAAGTIAPPVGVTSVLLTDVVTGDLYIQCSLDLYRWTGSAWVFYGALPSTMQPEAAGATMSNGSMTRLKRLLIDSGNPAAGYHFVLYQALRRDIVPATDVPLQVVVERQWQRAGLSSSLLDASALAGLNVRAMAVSQVTSPRQVLDNLAAAYLFEFVESGDGVRTVLRGGAPVATIPYEDLGAYTGDQSGEPLPRTRGNELELTSQVTIKFSNVDDNYQDGSETSTRLATGSSIVTVAEVPIGLTPTEAKRLAEKSVTDALAGIMRIGPVALTRKWAALEPTDVVLLTGKDGSLYRTRWAKRTDAGGLLTFEGISDDATAVNSSAVTSGGYNSSTIVRAISATDAVLLDIPILRDADNARGMYAAAKGNTTNWRGYGLYQSRDTVEFNRLASGTIPAVTGDCSVVPGAWAGGYVFDEYDSIVVDVGDGELSGTTRAALLADQTVNAFAIGAHGRWLLGQFRDATLTAPGVYELRGLLLGGRGTEQYIGTQLAGDKFVLLRSTGGVIRVPLDSSDQGVERRYKAVSFGRALASTGFRTLIEQEVGLMPLSPIALRSARSAGDLTLTWQRRTRLATRLTGPSGVVMPIGEESEAYSVDVFTDATFATVKRTLPTVTTNSVTYLAADQVADFGAAQTLVYVKVYQLSASVGRGFPAQKAA